MLRSLGADAIVYLLYDRWSLRRKRLAAWRAEVFQWARWDPEILRSTGQPRDGTDGTGWIWWKKCLNYGWIMLNYGWVVAGEMFGLKQSWKVQTSHLYHVSCMSCESCFFFFPVEACWNWTQPSCGGFRVSPGTKCQGSGWRHIDSEK